MISFQLTGTIMLCEQAKIGEYGVLDEYLSKKGLVLLKTSPLMAI